jgi:hypothetical protein
MISMSTRGGAAPTFSARTPAYAFIQKCLSLQQAAGPRGALERFFGMSPLIPEARGWYRDALGEIAVAQGLERLDDEWTVVHAIPGDVRELDIDHLAIGPGGVFTIITKAHSGQRVYAGGKIFQVGGSRKRYLRDAEHVAARASRLLSAAVGEQVAVTPIIVVTGASSLELADRPTVDVLSPARLGFFLRRHRRTLSDTSLARISRVATQQSTWQTDGSVVAEAGANLRVFDLLRAEVDNASARSRVWASAGIVSILLGLTAFFARVLPVLMTTHLAR